MFDATKNKYRDIQFTQYDTDDVGNAVLKQKFQVTGIPRLVFLDAGGNVLYNGGAFGDQAAFEEMIKQYR